jgi:subtilase family serine protease
VSYAVEVTNFGGSTARNARVVLRVDGAVVDSSDITALSPGATTTVRFSGPACSRSVRATVDPSDAIRETDESDNALTRACGG